VTQQDSNGNNHGTSSSNRVSEINDAVLTRDERAVGPMRLPDNRAGDFIDHFNRTYESLGMTVAPNEADPNEADPNEADPNKADPDEEKKIPGSREATGDDLEGLLR
jgi:hypothetical protein